MRWSWLFFTFPAVTLVSENLLPLSCETATYTGECEFPSNSAQVTYTYPFVGSTWMFSWSAKWPFEPLLTPFPLKVETRTRPWCCQVRPPSYERLSSSAIWYGDVKLNAWQT